LDDYQKNNAVIQFTAYSNEDGYTKDNLKIADDGRVLVYDKKRAADGLRGVDIGYAIVSKEIFDYMDDANENFEAVVYPKLVQKKALFATVTKHRYYSIGSFARIELTEKYLSGKKYIFLDRDGTMNLRPPKAEYICKPSDFVWIDGAREAIKRLNDAGYFVIMISNQAGIARGLMTMSDLESVQKKMTDDLAEIGAHIDAVYCCTHGWEDGCDCRKPKPGLLYQAQKDFSINLTECVMIGDDERDIMTAHNADMRGILVSDDYTLADAVEDVLSGKVAGSRNE
jgi:D-glycero-D-manno-heptose 1,7-bisphosphate phosphatase